METYIVWLQVFLKQQLKKRLYWVQIVLMVTGICCISAIRVPNAKLCTVGYCYDRTESEDWLASELDTSDRALDFCFYKEKNRLYTDILSGKIDCGFVLPVQLEKNSVIESITTPMSTKHALAKLTVFGVCYRVLSRQLLTDVDSRLYSKSDEKRLELLQQKNAEILDSDRVFDIRMEEVSVGRTEAEKQTACLPVQGVAGTFVVLIMLLAEGSTFDPKIRGVFQVLSVRRRACMSALYCLAAVLLPAVTALTCVCLSGRSRGLGVECISMMLLIVSAQAWMFTAGSRQKDADHYYVLCVLFLIIQLLICPVFTDLSQYLPALRIFRLLWPLGIYMYL